MLVQDVSYNCVELISKAVSCGSWFQEKFRMLVLVLQNSKVFQAVEVIR